MQHVRLADAIAFAADTSTLRVLADSIEQIGARSFAGRDRVMHHHVRGIIAMREGNWTAAEKHFASVTEFGGFGSMRSLLYQARSQLEQGQPRKAILTLHNAYALPLDGYLMYVPRSELDNVMSTAFERVGQRDSASVYAGYITRARGSDASMTRALAR